jgi:hypothetical protein
MMRNKEREREINALLLIHASIINPKRRSKRKQQGIRTALWYGWVPLPAAGQDWMWNVASWRDMAACPVA